MKNTITNVVLISLFVSLISCASSTQYIVKDNTGYGLEISKIKDPNLSLFRGNTETTKEEANRYSVLGALEDCAEKKQYALMSSTVDYSSNETSMQSYSVASMIGQTPVVQTNSYPVKQTSPLFITPYVCSAQYRQMGVPENIENASRELVNPITNDMIGGVLISEDFNIKDSVFKKSDIILNIGKIRIPDRMTFFSVKNSLSLGAHEVRVIRNGKIKNIKANITDDTKTIHNQNASVWHNICRKIKSDGTTKACEKVSLFLTEQHKKLLN